MAERVVVMGQGYVGLPVAVLAAERGFQVLGFDIDEHRCQRLAGGRSPIEDVSDQRLQAVLDSGAYRPSSDPTDLRGFDVAVVSVPTPLLDGAPDLTFVRSAGRALAPHVRPGSTVVLESTTWPGTTEELLGPILADGSGLTPGSDFHLGYSPERIDPGNQRWTLANTPKIVSGVDPESLKAVETFFGQIVECTVAMPTTKEAELAKLVENTFRHVNIALVNELAVFAHGMDIDIWATLDAAETKPFGFMRFNPGPGVGGHCLPIDPSYLSWRVKQSLGHPFRFIELANDINDHMPDYVIQRLTLALNDRGLAIRDRRILILGASYKKNTGDARESPSQRVCAALIALGAEVRIVDPFVAAQELPPGTRRVELSPAEVAAADAVIVLVDHDDFDRNLVLHSASYVLDCRGWLPRSPVVEHL